VREDLSGEGEMQQDRRELATRTPVLPLGL
jgi:hypothetical protein